MITLYILTLAMLVIVFITQLFKLYVHIKNNRKLDEFLREQGRVNNAVLDTAKATKALAASIGSQAIRTMKDVKDVVEKGVSDTAAITAEKVVSAVNNGPDSSITKTSKV